MPSLTVLIQNGDVCQCLREKKMYYAEGVELPADAQDILRPDDKPSQLPQGPFWCVLTQSLIGPDDGFANVETCKPGRSCCDTM